MSDEQEEFEQRHIKHGNCYQPVADSSKEHRGQARELDAKASRYDHRAEKLEENDNAK